MNWASIEIDHGEPICLFDVSKDKELEEALCRKNTQPLFKEVHQRKGIKPNFLVYLIQFIKSYQFLNEMKKENVKIFIDEVYNKPPKKIYPTNEIVYNHIDEIWCFDLADITDYKISNIKGFRYIFVMIDKFSKYLWTIPLKNKYSKTGAKAFSNILSTSKRLPLKLESDWGKEWYNNILHSFLKGKNIQHYSRFTDKCPSMAERVIRTIRNLLKKPVFEKGKTDWVSELSSIIRKQNIYKII